MSTKKQLTTAIETNLLAEITEARKDLARVELALKDTVTRHFDYVDKQGNKGTSKAGFYLNINKKTKAAFARDRDHMSLAEYLLLKAMLAQLSEVITQGELNGLSRKDIKKAVYSTIDDFGGLAEVIR